MRTTGTQFTPHQSHIPPCLSSNPLYLLYGDRIAIIILMSKYKYEREFMFSTHRLEQIQIFLQNEEKPLDLLLIRDTHKNTVIHHWAYQNQAHILQCYIRYYRKNMENRACSYEEIKTKTRTLLNQLNGEGYTAAHYASYRGNVAVLKLLERYQANLHLTSSLGMNLLHMAAQGDKVGTVLYLDNKQFDINAQDSKKSTALHWASFAGSDKVVQYLLSQSDIQIDLLDEEGQTPLHISTLYGYNKIVKLLLMSGANRRTLNLKGQTALQLAEENEFNSIKNILNDNYSLMDYLKFACNIKTKYEPKSRSSCQPLCFILLFCLIASVNFGLIKFSSNIVLGVQAFVFAATLFLFLLLIRSPKQQQRGHSYSDYASSEKIFNLCMVCIRPMRPRERHCSTCHICIPQYDHHCPWINNCVGKHNLKSFVIFIITIEAVLFWLGYVGVMLILVEQGLTDSCLLFEISSWVHDSDLGILLYAGAGVTLLLFIFFAVPLLSLIYVQIKNLLLGKTTYERFTKSSQSILTRQGSVFLNESQSVPRLSFRNCRMMCRSEQQDIKQQSNSTSSSFVREH